MKILVTNNKEMLNKSCIPDCIQEQILGKEIEVEKVGSHETNYFVRYKGYLMTTDMFKRLTI